MKTNADIRYEEQYISVLKDVIENGDDISNDRTGVGTMMLPGVSFKVDLSKEFPLLTTKWVGLKDVFRELKWMISGDTCETSLKDSGCSIWSEWAGESGQLGPIYPAMWRRRPVSVVFKKPIAPNFDHDDNYIDYRRLLGLSHDIRNGHNMAKASGRDSSTDLAIGAILGKVIQYAIHQAGKFYKPWLDYEVFKKDFFKLAGSEQAIVNKHFAPLIFHKNTNKVGPDTLEFVEASTAHIAYSRIQSREQAVRMPVYYIDQLADVIERLKGPGDRRMIVDSWDPAVLPVEGLPPSEQASVGRQALACCHCMFQFHKHPPKSAGQKSRVSITVTQRSQDLVLGNPYNMASYAMLLMMVCNIVDCDPYMLTLNAGDAHIYKNHIDTLKEQLANDVLQTPTVVIKEGVKHSRLEDFEFEDFEITRYGDSPKVKYPVAV